MSGQLVLVNHILPDEQIVLDRSARAPAAGEVPPVRVAPGPHVGQDLLAAALHHHPRQVGLHAHHLDVQLVPGDGPQHLVTAELGGNVDKPSAPSMSRMSQCTVGGGRDTASSSVYSGTHCSSSELAVACRQRL